MAQNVIENVVMGSLGGVIINYPKFPSIFQSNIGSGNVDIYTVPAGMRAAIYSIQAYNSAGTSTTWNMQFKVSGTYYRAGINTTTGAGAASNIVLSPSIILEAGEIMSVATSQAGLNVWFRVMLFDVSNGLKSSKVLGPTTGSNTIYTVPTGKSAFVLGRNLDINDNGGSGGTVMVSAGATGTTWDIRVVQNGGSPGTTNSVQNGSASANTVGVAGCAKSLSSGDFISVLIGTGDAAQVFWVNVMEV